MLWIGLAVLMVSACGLPKEPQVRPNFLRGLDPPLVNHQAGDVVFTYTVRRPYEEICSAVRAELTNDGWTVDNSDARFMSLSKKDPVVGLKLAVVTVTHGSPPGAAAKYRDLSASTIMIFETAGP